MVAAAFARNRGSNSGSNLSEPETISHDANDAVKRKNHVAPPTGAGSNPAAPTGCLQSSRGLQGLRKPQNSPLRGGLGGSNGALVRRLPEAVSAGPHTRARSTTAHAG
jgi:hypothetical protein